MSRRLDHEEATSRKKRGEEANIFTASRPLCLFPLFPPASLSTHSSLPTWLIICEGLHKKGFVTHDSRQSSIFEKKNGERPATMCFLFDYGIDGDDLLAITYHTFVCHV